MNYLASPPLVVAYALAGTMDKDLYTEPLGTGTDGQDVFLRDIWPTAAEVSELVESTVRSSMFTKTYDEIFDGAERRNSLKIASGDRFPWHDETSNYIHRPPRPEERHGRQGCRRTGKNRW